MVLTGGHGAEDECDLDGQVLQSLLQAARQAGVSSVLSVPLRAKDRVIGLIRIYAKRRRRFRITRELEGALARRIHELLDVRIEFSRQIPGWVDRLLARQARPYALIEEQIGSFLKQAEK